MDKKYWSEIQNNEIVKKRLAKLMAKYCFRNLELENLHGGPKFRFNDDEMKELMKDLVNNCYDFLNHLFSSRGHIVVEKLKQKDYFPEWDEPVTKGDYSVLPLEISDLGERKK